MKKIISALLPLILLGACVDSEDESETSGFNIECKDQADGWTDAEDRFVDANGNTYLINGEWHCKNEYLQTETDSDHIYGELIVTKIGEVAPEQSIAIYTFITRPPQPQHVIIQSIDTNDNFTGEIHSLHTDFRFETDQKLFPQLLKMSSVRTANISDASADYYMQYNVTNREVEQITNSRISSITNNSYTLNEKSCSPLANINTDWLCKNYKVDADINKNKGDISGSTTTTPMNIELNPSISLLQDPLQADTEIKRLAALLGF